MRCSPSTACLRRSLLGLGGEGRGSARGVWMCARGAVLLRTRLQMQPCTAIFRHPFSQQCRLKIQLRLLIGIFITILSAAPA